jgi:hypothetical protein
MDFGIRLRRPLCCSKIKTDKGASRLHVDGDEYKGNTDIPQKGNVMTDSDLRTSML